jgi:hypothetical protein
MLRICYRESLYEFSLLVFVNPICLSLCLSVSLRHTAFPSGYLEFINNDRLSEYLHKRMFSPQCWQPTACLETLYGLRRWMV